MEMTRYHSNWYLDFQFWPISSVLVEFKLLFYSWSNSVGKTLLKIILKNLK